MDKVQLVVSETFCSQNEEERRQNIQQAVDRYLRLRLQVEEHPWEGEDEP